MQARMIRLGQRVQPITLYRKYAHVVDSEHRNKVAQIFGSIPSYRMSIGKIYGQEHNPRVVRSLAAAKFNGLELERVNVQPPSDTQKPEFLAKFPVGKVPAFEGSDGFLLCESRAIVEYGTYTNDEGNIG